MVILPRERSQCPSMSFGREGGECDLDGEGGAQAREHSARFPHRQDQNTIVPAPLPRLPQDPNNPGVDRH